MNAYIVHFDTFCTTSYYIEIMRFLASSMFPLCAEVRFLFPHVDMPTFYQTKLQINLFDMSTVAMQCVQFLPYTQSLSWCMCGTYIVPRGIHRTCCREQRLPLTSDDLGRPRVEPENWHLRRLSGCGALLLVSSCPVLHGVALRVSSSHCTFQIVSDLIDAVFTRLFFALCYAHHNT